MKALLLAFVLVLNLVSSQRDNRVHVVNHVDYILKILQETVSEVERREWCNLKLFDFIKPINETVIDHHYEGTVTYTNGFVTSIQQTDVLQSSVQQVWSWSNDQRTGTASLQGTLRFTGMGLGYDVIVDVGGPKHYTAVFTHPLVSFDFKIIYSIEKEVVENVTVEGIVPRTSNLVPEILPKDMTSDVITTLFDPLDTVEGVQALGSSVFQPIAADVVARIEFPRICYDCTL